MDPRKKQYLHIALMAVAITSSVASIETLFMVGATRWTMAFKTRPIRQP